MWSAQFPALSQARPKSSRLFAPIRFPPRPAPWTRSCWYCRSISADAVTPPTGSSSTKESQSTRHWRGNKSEERLSVSSPSNSPSTFKCPPGSGCLSAVFWGARHCSITLKPEASYWSSASSPSKSGQPAKTAWSPRATASGYPRQGRCFPSTSITAGTSTTRRGPRWWAPTSSPIPRPWAWFPGQT